MNAVLRAFGFESVNLADHSAAQQAKLLNTTEVVIGTFGTDLASMFHFGPKTSLIMLIQGEAHESGVVEDVRAHERYCTILGMRVHPLVCKAVGDVGPVTGATRRLLLQRDMSVDCDLLRALIAEVVAQRG